MDKYSWYNSLKHGGMLVAPSRLASSDCFPDELPPLPGYLAERLRRDLVRLETGKATEASEFVSTVLEAVCGINGTGTWARGADVEASYSRRAATGEMIRPRRGVARTERRGAAGLRGQREAAGHWTRAAHGVARGGVAAATGQKLALLTNHRQWRLIYAGLDHEAWAEWDTELWFEEGKPGLQVDALRALISALTLVPTAAGEQAPLISAILDSRKGEAELSATLGERVRQAVELRKARKNRVESRRTGEKR